MKYSIIIPVYNVKAYLHRCIDSVICQNNPDYEVILVDDGSADGSGQICDEYAGKFDYIKVLHQTNQGLAATRNSGLSIASGDWILFVDSDDYFSEDFLTVVERIVNKQPADFYKFNYMKIVYINTFINKKHKQQIKILSFINNFHYQVLWQNRKRFINTFNYLI